MRKGLESQRRIACAMGVLSLCFTMTAPVLAGDLYSQGNWSSLASDRAAANVGDSLTVLIQEASQAYDTTKNVSSGGIGLSGQYSGSSAGSGQLGASGDVNHSANGQHGRSGQMVAQISVVVDEVLPNGDLHVSGDQLININGEKTQIHLKGRVRRADISTSNTVFSTSLADATIVYGGPGLTGNPENPGNIKRVMSWFKP